MTKPLVSWLMPVYNGEKHIRRALDSMLNQTYQCFEVVLIIEHGCTDQTAFICAEYAARDARILVYQNEKNLGVARSLNRGLALCGGSYIARMDADDFSHADRLEKQVLYMEAHPEVSVLGTWCEVIFDNGQMQVAEYPTDSETIRTSHLFGATLAHPTVMLRKEDFIQNHWSYPDGEAEDYALWAKLISHAKIACLPDALLDYYKHGSSATSVRFQAVRAASAAISKEALLHELGIDTTLYSDSYFGWRDFDILPYDLVQFLYMGSRLLCQVKAANERLCKFENQVLINVLDKQWQQTKRVARMGMLHVPYDAIDYHALQNASEQIKMLLYHRKRAIVYGTGRFSIDNIPKIEKIASLEIIAYCDSNERKQGRIFFGKPVYAPEQLGTLSFDYILIASPLFDKEIRLRLINEFHMPEAKILSMPSAGELAFHKRRDFYDKLYAHADETPKAYLFCAPDYGNLGDHAIAEAERRFFLERFHMEPVEVPYGLFEDVAEVVRRHIRPTDLILITGGGFLGSLWFALEAQAREVIKAYPCNPIVVMPQTLYWEHETKWADEQEKTRRVYAAHSHLRLCARDRETFHLMQEAYPGCQVLLVPDMVLYDQWDGFFDDAMERDGVLLCLKTDKESILSDAEREGLFAVGKKLCGTAYFGTTDLAASVAPKDRIDLLCEKLNQFRAARLVITDRLHGLIFAAITGTPCIAINNSNHKLRATFQWVKHLPYVCFVENLDQVEAAADVLLHNGPGRYKSTLLLQSFANLENEIQNHLNNH